MKKILKKYGNTHVLTFTADELKVYGLEEGCVVDISDITVIQRPLVFDELLADENITKILKEQTKQHNNNK